MVNTRLWCKYIHNDRAFLRGTFFALLMGSVFIPCVPFTQAHASEYEFSAIHDDTLFTESWLDAMSQDGSVLAGTGFTSSYFEYAWRWTSAGMQIIHDNALFTNSWTNVISQNGSVIAGYGEDIATGGSHAWRWTTSGMQNIHNASLFTDSYVYAISQDGSVLAGYGEDIASGNSHAWRWTSAGMQNIHDDSLFTGSETYHISRDGSVIAGIGYINSDGYAWRWTSATGMQNIHDNSLFTRSYIEAISQDGSVIAGGGMNASNEQNAWRWTNATGMKNIHDDAVFANSWASLMSQNGAVIAGYGWDNVSGNSHAWRWTSAGMQSIHDDSLFTESNVYAISQDGSVLGGYGADIVSGNSHAWRWTSAGMQNIHDDSLFTASKTYHMSQDGSVLAGIGEDNAITGHSLGVFRWTDATGMQDIYQLLADADIDMSGWDQMDDGRAQVFMSSNGMRMAGTGIYNGTLQPWIFAIKEEEEDDDGGGSQPEPGIITPQELAKSAAATAVPSQQAQTVFAQHNSQSMAVARNALQVYLTPSFASYSAAPQSISPASGKGLKARLDKAAYITGSFGAGGMNNYSNHNTVGSTGMLFRLSGDVAIGAGVLYGYNREETYLGGNSRTHTTGLSMMGTYEPQDSNLRVYGIATAAKLDVKTNRHYLNGNTIQGARGETDGMGYGVALRTGYVLDSTAMTQIMPYVEADISHTRLDGYKESGGVFAGDVGNVSNTYLASRIGAEVSHPLNTTTTIRGRAAWGHRYSTGGSVVSTIAGISQGMAVESGNRDWVDVGVNVTYTMTDRISLTGDLGGRIGRTSEPAVNVVGGMIWKF